MNSLTIESTETSPKISLDPSGKLLMEGESRPENVVKFFEPIMAWLQEYQQAVKDGSVSKTAAFDFKLEYFNSSSAKFIMDVFIELEKAVQNGLSLQINWYYEELDEDLLESGEEYQKLVKIPFNFIPITD